MNKLLQSLLLIFLLAGVSVQSFAATVTWDGGAGTTNWMDAMNWDTDMVPTATDDVVVNATVVLSTSTQVQRVLVSGSSADLTIAMGVTLTIDGYNGGDDGLEVSSSGGVVTNNGIIAISNIDTDDTNADGLYNKGMFTNNGTITIDNVGQHGLYVQGGTFTNNAGKTISVTNIGGGDSNADYVYLDDNSGTISNLENYGDLDVIMTGNDDGIYIKDGCVITNHSTGDISITSTGGGDMPLHIVGGSGLATPSTLNNAGLFTIDGTGTSDYGIQIDGANTSTTATTTAIIINSGTLTVNNPGDNSSDDGIRIRRSGVMTNSVGGTVNINNAKDEGIQIEDANYSTGMLNNSGTININSAADHGMECFGTFNNLSGGVFNAFNCTDDGIRVVETSVSLFGTVNNDGTLQINGSGSDDIEVETGSVFVNTANAVIIPGASPGEMEIKGNTNLGTATVNIEITGTVHTTEYDRIEVVNFNTTNGDYSSIDITNTILNLDWGSFVPAVSDQFEIVKANSTGGTVTGSFASVTTSNSDIVTSVTNTGNSIIVEVTAIVPVEMTYFIGNKTAEGNLLQWETATELINEGFEVQKSADGENWEAIGFVAGNGTTIEVSNYEFLDNNVSNNENYYRLKQLDTDGKFEYSRTILIVGETQNTTAWKTYPNPVKSQLTIEGFEGVVIIYNMLGQPLRTINVVDNMTVLPLADLENGQYFIAMNATDGSRTVRQLVKISE